MKQVDFYLISNRIIDAKFKLASRLSNKLQRLGQKALVITDDDAATTSLDQVMWSYSDTSFLAHERAGVEPAVSSIQIGAAQMITPQVLETGYDVLINVSSGIPTFSTQFARIAEIVEQDDASKEAARMRYKQYQSQGIELKTHPIEL